MPSFSTSKNRSKQVSGVNYPTPFLEQFQQQFGPGLTTSEVAGGLPRPTSLFADTTPNVGRAATTSTGAPGAGLGLPTTSTGGPFRSPTQTVSDLGFGTRPNYAGPGAVTTPMVRAPDTSTLFEAQFRPVEREITRQGAIADRQTQAELADAGLASSGAGFGTLGRQQRERSQQIQAAATDAATQAALQSAGFNFQAQQVNASNVLQGNLANAQNYLQTLGLNEQSAQAARASFLQLMGLQEADLQRLDATQQSNLTTVLNNWLQQFSAVTNAGQYSAGAAHGSSVGGKL